MVISHDRARQQALQVSTLPEWARGEEGRPSSRLIVHTPVEALDDAWFVFRSLRPALAEDGQLTVHSSIAHGHGLRPYYVDTLLRLGGFIPKAVQRSRMDYSVMATKRPILARELSCSVVVPCKNEEDNVEPLLRRLPGLGTRTELIFVDGASTDHTVDRVQRLIDDYPERDIRLLHQRRAGGKASAVFQGFDAATGDIVMILDADMTVAPEDLPRFFLALAEGVADFANGSRFGFPMESGAMPPLNQLGNRVFSGLFSWLLGGPITDTLCGTKACFRSDWHRIDRARRTLGGHDPWGDFDLLLGARMVGLSLVDVPIRYGARVAGESKMHPLRHGAILATATAAGVRRLKIEPMMWRIRPS
ncbi:MAG: hypothetical protein NVS4B2_28750 [Chloroflexota bacterium]